MNARNKRRRSSVVALLGTMALALAVAMHLSACAACPPRPGPSAPAQPAAALLPPPGEQPAARQRWASLEPMLEPYLARYGLPALAAAVVKDGTIIAAGAVGTRRVGAQVPVTVADRFHIGSDTKAMTALIAAMLVEQGKLRWDSQLAEVFPELADEMDPGLRDVTLEQLLSHTSGIPSDNERFGELLGKSMLEEGNLDELRYWLVSQWVREPLAHEPGRVFAYSNMGYTIAGAMLERVAGKSWEELVTERVFLPLGLHSAGLGPQSSLGKIDAPLGHRTRDGKLTPMLAGPSGDNPPIIGPAGTAHMSVLDFAAWAAWNAGAGKRGPALVRPETLAKLHTPVIAMPPKKDAAPGTPSRGKYALGWGQIAFDWCAEPFIYHGGSNEMNLAHILVQPRTDFGLVLMTNVGNATAKEAFLALAQALYRQYAAPP